MEKLTVRLTPLIAMVGFSAAVIAFSLSRQTRKAEQRQAEQRQAEQSQAESQIIAAMEAQSEIGCFQPIVLRDRKHKTKTIVVSPPESFTVPDKIPAEGVLSFKRPHPVSQTVQIGTNAH